MNADQIKAALSEIGRRGGKAGRGDKKARTGTAKHALAWWQSPASIPFRSKKPKKPNRVTAQSVLEQPNQ
jgi:hypothetical protein